MIRLLMGAVIVAALIWFVLPFALPIPANLLKSPAQSPVLLDRHGVVIHQLTLPDSSRANVVPLEKISPDLIACTLAAEDKRFYRHGGIDLLATLRAASDFVAKRRVVSGASTITQQLVKISSPPARRRPLTKIREALVARRLEMTWSKNEILAAYLNRLDYGNLRFGTAEAARFYFQKSLDDLSLGECALLAGLPQAPSRLNPIRHPKRAMVRRNTVLHRLAAAGGVDAQRVRAALLETLALRPLVETQPAPWMVQQVEKLKSTSPIRSTLDLAIQRDLETIVREETAKLKESNLRHAAVVAIHNATGEVLALVSSADWNDARGGQLNGALSPRSPGSTLKPFTYLLAMERNHRTPASILADIVSPLRTPQGLDLPQNYDRQYRGPVTLRSALACSLNVPALREMNLLGGPQSLHEMLEDLGITTLGEDPEVHGLGLTIGNAPVRLLELCGAYATLARLGQHRDVILFPASSPTPPRPLLDHTASYLIADILSDSQARAPSFQPGGPLDLPFRCAVKTGTSSDFHDNWCIGYTPEFTVGVWAGNFEHQPMKGLSGVDGAAPIFHRSMLRLHREVNPTWYEKPKDLVEIFIDPRNGKRVTADAKFARREWLPERMIPLVASSNDYTADGKALLDSNFGEWFSSRYNLRQGELAMRDHPEPSEPLRIISPAADATYLLDPEIPSGSDRLRPVTNLPGLARWHSDTLRIEAGTPEPMIHLKPGVHIVTATDSVTGVVHTLTLRVKTL